jgi:hypothetical protein
MAETIFAGKKVEEFALQDRFATFGFCKAVFMDLPEYFFVGESPGNASHRNGQYEKINEL